MNQRENFFAMLEGKKPEFIPNVMELYKMCAMGTCLVDYPMMGGLDAYGVNWVTTPEGAIPEPNKFMFDDIAEWKNYVQFPDVDTLGIEQAAAMEMTNFVRGEQIVNVISMSGLFERMAALMGFENTLCALIEDPDACREFFDAVADFRIKVHDKYIEAYQPDMITYFDDLATAKGLFMSPQTYRDVIKPAHQRIVDAVISKGVIFNQHTCGKCESIIEDYVEMGIKVWNSAQIMNDLEHIMEKYQGQLIVEGGWDSMGPVSFIGATTEQVVEETIRCAKTYGKYGNYILFPILLNENGNGLLNGDPRIGPMIQTWNSVNKLW